MYVSTTALMASNYIPRFADFSTDVQRQGLALFMTFIAVLAILRWTGLRKWAPAISLAVQVLIMDVGGEFLYPMSFFSVVYWQEAPKGTFRHWRGTSALAPCCDKVEARIRGPWWNRIQVAIIFRWSWRWLTASVFQFMHQTWRPSTLRCMKMC